jgi:hypothetical protein
MSAAIATPETRNVTTLVLASRTYQPLSDLDAHLRGNLVAFGTTALAKRAEKFGARIKPLETTRATLLDLATEPDTEIVLFVARDPDTKQPTEGMSQIQHLLSTKSIPFTVVSSPFPARICSLLTEFNEKVEKALSTVDSAGGRRKLVLTQRVLELAAQVGDARDEYAVKLDEGKDFGVGDEALDAKWATWLRVYESLCDALERAKALLA